jgi:sialic acid synthase SpsE
VEQAVISAKGSENENVILLHCTSNYPANPAHANLKAIQTLQTAFGVPVGYSDHTAGITVTLGAVACGACILEKHFTLNRELPGPDQSSSLQPEEFQELVRQVRVMESAMGNGIKIPAPGEADTARVARKSIVARVDIPAGELLTENHLMIKRPGIGLPPAMLHFVVGRTARITILKDECIRIDMLQ